VTVQSATIRPRSHGCVPLPSQIIRPTRSSSADVVDEGMKSLRRHAHRGDSASLGPGAEKGPETLLACIGQ
jgi:hypothetical protein